MILLGKRKPRLLWLKYKENHSIRGKLHVRELKFGLLRKTFVSSIMRLYVFNKNQGKA